MPHAYVLDLSHTKIGIGLALIRRVCNPDSTSYPHITVRYSSKVPNTRIVTSYAELSVSNIIVTQPSIFRQHGSSRQNTSVVFLECAIPNLSRLSYKPDFPDSVFHITLYQGKNTDFADLLLHELSRLEWPISIDLIPEMRLTFISLPEPQTSKLNRISQEDLLRLLRFVWHERATLDDLADLSLHKRVELVTRISKQLVEASKPIQKLDEIIIPRIDNPISIQPELTDQDGSPWSLIDDTVFELFQHQSRDTYGDCLFLTPPELASEITEFCLDLLPQNTAIAFGDPALGNGVFFSTLTDYLEDSPQFELDTALGVEINAERSQRTQAIYRRNLKVVHGDFLKLRKLEPRNLIIANPPYLRYQDLDRNETRYYQRRIKSALGIEVPGSASLYVYYLLICHEWLVDDGISAWLLPSDFLFTNYGKAVREYLSSRVQLIRLHVYSSLDLQFEKALVSSCLVVFRNRIPSDDSCFEYSSGGSILHPEYQHSVSTRDLKVNDNWQATLAGHIAVGTNTLLGQYFDVTRGVATGANDFFVLTREKADQLQVPAAWLRPILPKSRFLSGSVIETLSQNEKLGVDQVFLLDVDASLESLQKSYPQLYEYFHSNENLAQRTLLKSRRPWYRQERREPPPYLVNYMGSLKGTNAPIRFFFNRTRAIALNNYVCIYPNKLMKDILGDDDSRYLRVFQFLQSIPLDNFLSVGRVYGGGLLKIEPRGLRALPIGDFVSLIEDLSDSN